MARLFNVKRALFELWPMACVQRLLSSRLDRRTRTFGHKRPVAASKSGRSTFELSRLLRLMKPDVAGRLQRGGSHG